MPAPNPIPQPLNPPPPAPPSSTVQESSEPLQR
jgi:hypothetical protein